MTKLASALPDGHGLDAVRRRETVLRRSLGSARARFYEEELDLRDYPAIVHSANSPLFNFHRLSYSTEFFYLSQRIVLAGNRTLR
jgi:hypothetical protein